MKKVFALILVLTLLTVPLYAAVATGVDLSGMTNEELTSLKQQLDAEMLERGMLTMAVLPIGRYTVGVDLPQGNYEFGKANVDDLESGYGLYVNEAAEKNDANFAEYYFFTDNAVKKVTLTNGQILIIGSGPMKLTIFNGIQWQ